MGLFMYQLNHIVYGSDVTTRYIVILMWVRNSQVGLYLISNFNFIQVTRSDIFDFQFSDNFRNTNIIF